MKRLIYLLTILAIFFGCTRDNQEEKYLAKVNNEILRYEDFRASFDDNTWSTMTKKEKETNLQEWVNLTALAQKCDQEKISELPIIQERIKSSIKKIKANAIIANKLNSININEEELFNYYQLHKREYLKKITEYKYQRILIAEPEKLEEAVLELKNGLKFKEAAIKYSEEPAGKTGGYFGFISAGDVHEDIWNALNGLDQYTWKSLKISDRFYILRWYEKREAEIEKNYSEMKDSLRIKLMEEKRDEKYKEIMREIESNTDIEINYLPDGDIK